MARPRELSRVQFVREVLAFFSPHRALELAAFCAIYGMAGYPSPAKIASRGGSLMGLKRAAVYRCFQDLRRLRQHLVALGYERLELRDDTNTYELSIDLLAEGGEQAVDRKIVDAMADIVQVPGQTGAIPATV